MELSACHITQATGLSYRRLDHSIRAIAFRPTGGGGHGPGSRRRFGWRDLLVFALVADVLENGIPLRAVVPALRLVQRSGDLPSLERLRGYAIWTDGRRARLLPPARRGLPSLRTGAVAHVLALGTAAVRVQARLKKIVTNA
jgi:hypothetical protein